MLSHVIITSQICRTVLRYNIIIARRIVSRDTHIHTHEKKSNVKVQTKIWIKWKWVRISFAKLNSSSTFPLHLTEISKGEKIFYVNIYYEEKNTIQNTIVRIFNCFLFCYFCHFLFPLSYFNTKNHRFLMKWWKKSFLNKMVKKTGKKSW